MSSKTETKKATQTGIDKPISNFLYFDSNTYKLWVVTFTVFAVSFLFVNRMIGFPTSIGSLIFLGIIHCILWAITSIVIDYIYYVYGIEFYNPREVVSRGYSISAYLNDTLHSVGLDYGFNFYDGNYNKTRSQAQIDKFEYTIATLGIKKGDKVIDVGCGCGDWIQYLKEKYDCDVYGVNITYAQTKECHSRGLNNVIWSDWKDILLDNEKGKKLQKQLYGKFDAVTFWDTVEHYVSMGEGLGRRKNRYKIYGNMFKLAKNLLNKDSKHSDKMKVWISCLHMRREVWVKPFDVIKALLCGQQIEFHSGKDGKTVQRGSVKEYIQKMAYVYLLDKYHSGFYPSYYFDSTTKMFHDELVENGELQGFKLVTRKDTTMDYYMTSVLNPTHFGRHHYSLNLQRLIVNGLSMLIDPYWFHRRMWFFKESWMYQFDPKDLENSDVILWWLHFQLDNKN